MREREWTERFMSYSVTNMLKYLKHRIVGTWIKVWQQRSRKVVGLSYNLVVESLVLRDGLQQWKIEMSR